MEDIDKIEAFANHSHSSSKKQNLIERSSEDFSSESSESFGSEESYEAKEDEIVEQKLHPGQTIDTDPLLTSSDAPKDNIRGFLSNVIKDKTLNTITVVIDVHGTEFNYLANNKTQITLGANPGIIDDLLPNETIVFSASNLILTNVRIIAGVTKGIVTHVDDVTDVIKLQETDKKKRPPLI